MKKVLLLTSILLCSLFYVLQAQNVFNPNDLNRRWVNNGTNYSNDSTLLTANPNPNILGLQKWVSVKTSGIDSGAWGKDYKPYFINLNGIQLSFRIKYPKSYSNPDSASKKYPAMLFFHGAGEPGCPSNGGIYNNEKQLVHGGQTFRNRVENNQFDGFLLYPQVVTGSGCWSDWGIAGYAVNYNAIIAMLDSMGKYTRLDIDRVLVDGLSNGGVAAWSMTAVFPQRVAKSAPSAAASQQTNYSDFVHIPIWFATGGKDTNPSPAYAQSTYDGVKNLGGNITWTLYPDLGHFVWTTHWAELNFVPFMNDMHKANPLVYFQRYDFCPDSAINPKIGITAGFYAYEWQKDGVTIATRVNGVNTIINGTSIISYTGNEITVNAFGTYRVRFKRTATADWSVWSPKPAVIYPKATTITPPITVSGLQSKVLPAVDGSTSVLLTLPTGYYGYQWVRVGDNAVVSTSNTFNAPIGDYKAKIVEQFGCGSNFSPTFTVIGAAGSPKPDGAKNLSAYANSVSGIQLEWNENPNAGQNETGFEIYRSTASGGPYQLIAITAPDVVTYLDQSIASSTQYYYVVRAVSAFGAAASSNEAAATAQKDLLPPSVPSGLIVTCASRTNVTLKWNASTDNLAVDKYDIYINGVKSYSTSQTSFAINELTSLQTFAFSVRARDAAGNISQPSNQVNANTAMQGLCYKYYLNAGGLTEIPNYNILTPTAQGMAPNVAFSAGGVDNFGYLWEGYINITTAGNYRFQTCSDDGSKFYLNQPYNHAAAETVSNDGLHGTTCANSATIALTAGVYPVAATFFEAGGGESMTLNWSLNGAVFTIIPNANFTETFVPSGSAPAAPSNVSALAQSFNKIIISWTDNSSNETGFELVRSTSPVGTYDAVATVSGTSYTDSGLNANTTYYYKVRAIGTFGQSSYASAETIWKLNNTYADDLGSTTRILAGGGGSANPTFTGADKIEGSHSSSFDGIDDYVVVNNSSGGGFPSDGIFTQRSVSIWVKPTVTTGKRMLFDFGGPDNGLALRFNGNSLEAGVASGGTRATISLANFANSSFWVAASWNNIVLVYSTNSIRLYLNGTQVASNTSLSFSSIIANSTSQSRLGYPNTENAFNDVQTTYAFYSGLMDNVHMRVNEAASASEAVAFAANNHGQSMDTTLAAPAVPNAPSNLVAQVVSKDNINLTWNDNSSDETIFEVWRSVGNQANYRVIKTIAGGPGSTKSYSDNALFANVTYYYVIKAVNLGGTSANSNLAVATTLNTNPVITNILDFTMKYATVYALPVNAIDEDGDPMVFTFENLPYFASIENVSNGNINVVFAPTVGDQGAYTIIAVVNDGHNGYDTTFFTMVINDNTVPVMPVIPDKVVDEGKTLVVPLSANDAEGNNYMVWTFANMPSFATFVDSGNGKGSLTFKPGYAASGTYSMTAYADDGNGAWASRKFKIIVNEVDPNESMRINFKTYSGNVPTWNDVDLYATAPFNKPSLITVKGQITPIGVTALNTHYGGTAAGVQTGNNSGVYPDAVLKDYMEWGTYNYGSTDTMRLRFYGLDTARRYNFVFFGSSTVNCCGVNSNSVTTYRINNEVATVRFYLNSTETDTIYQVKPNISGQIDITMIGDANTAQGGVLNTLVVDAAYDDGSTPSKPLNLKAYFTENAGVRLTWTDRSYNEFSYKVYRATAKAGPYTLLNPGVQNKDSVEYTDITTTQYTSYFYYVAGANNYGNGASSDTVNIITENNKPIIENLENFKVKADASFQENFTVTDYLTDVVTVSIDRSPSFITLINLGNGNYRISATPTIDNLGQHFLTVVAKDDKGGVTTKDFIITVADKNTNSIFVSFGDYSKVSPAPWNNFLHYGLPGISINNLVDENNNPTSINMTMIEGWSSMFLTGHKTGNNSGVVPDSVLSGGIYYTGINTRSISITGLSLSPTKRYNIVVVGSQNEGYEAVMRITTNVGSQSDTLNGKYNTNLTGNLNGLTASGGAITVNFIKLSGNAMYLNAIIIEEYESSIPILNPVNLYVEPKNQTSVVLSWSDRSNNENAASDGFQLQRATDSLFTQNITNINIWGNNSTYTNTGLSANTKYWYRIRAKNGTSVFSDWSNRGKTITPQSMIYVNFNQNVQNAGSPWNNMQSFPSVGVSYANLKNQSNINTGYALTISKTFNGENNAGMSTGNNSGMGGLVPDLVMQSGYWIDNVQQAQMKISGLNQTKRYRIGYISSSNWIGGNLTATLTVNGRTVFINSWQNTSKIVYIGDLQPNSSGELELNFSSIELAANAYSSGLIIEAYDDVNGGAVVNSINPGQKYNGTVTEEESASPNLLLTAGKENQVEVNIYPNPFKDGVNLDFTNSSSENTIGVDVYDMAGRMVMKQNFGKLGEGVNTLRLSTPEGKMPTGVYLLALTVNGKTMSVTKLVKSKQ